MFSPAGKDLIKINNDNNVVYSLKKNKNYYMYLPATNELLYLSCSGMLNIRGVIDLISNPLLLNNEMMVDLVKNRR